MNECFSCSYCTSWLELLASDWAGGGVEDKSGEQVGQSVLYNLYSHWPPVPSPSTNTQNWWLTAPRRLLPFSFSLSVLTVNNSTQRLLQWLIGVESPVDLILSTKQLCLTVFLCMFTKKMASESGEAANRLAAVDFTAVSHQCRDNEQMKEDWQRRPQQHDLDNTNGAVRVCVAGTAWASGTLPAQAHFRPLSW